MPQNSNCRLPLGHRFRPKFDFKVMAPNHGGDPLGSILGSMGSQKWVKTIKIPCPKFRIFDYILVPMGSRWVKKWIKTAKNYHTPKFEFSITPRSLISAKIWLNSYGAKSRLGPRRVSLGKKMGQNRKKLPCPKIRIFHYPAVINFVQNSTLRFFGTKSRWGPSRVHIGANGSHWVKKMGQNRKKLPCPKIRIVDYPSVIDLGQNSTLRLWLKITVGTP